MVGNSSFYFKTCWTSFDISRLPIDSHHILPTPNPWCIRLQMSYCWYVHPKHNIILFILVLKTNNVKSFKRHLIILYQIITEDLVFLAKWAWKWSLGLNTSLVHLDFFPLPDSLVIWCLAVPCCIFLLILNLHAKKKQCTFLSILTWLFKKHSHIASQSEGVGTLWDS